MSKTARTLIVPFEFVAGFLLVFALIFCVLCMYVYLRLREALELVPAFLLLGYLAVLMVVTLAYNLLPHRRREELGMRLWIELGTGEWGPRKEWI